MSIPKNTYTDNEVAYKVLEALTASETLEEELQQYRKAIRKYLKKSFGISKKQFKRVFSFRLLTELLRPTEHVRKFMGKVLEFNDLESESDSETEENEQKSVDVMMGSIVDLNQMLDEDGIKIVSSQNNLFEHNVPFERQVTIKRRRLEPEISNLTEKKDVEKDVVEKKEVVEDVEKKEEEVAEDVEKKDEEVEKEVEKEVEDVEEKDTNVKVEKEVENEVSDVVDVVDEKDTDVEVEKEEDTDSEHDQKKKDPHVKKLRKLLKKKGVNIKKFTFTSNDNNVNVKGEKEQEKKYMDELSFFCRRNGGGRWTVSRKNVDSLYEEWKRNK